jgi:hypothetical protein
MRITPLLVSGLLGALGAQQSTVQDRQFEWRTDLAAAEREAARTGRPLLLVFR